jgi:hypothetical protein
MNSDVTRWIEDQRTVRIVTLDSDERPFSPRGLWNSAIEMDDRAELEMCVTGFICICVSV